MKKILVIGGGAAGMMAAIEAARNGATVTLLEKNEKLGKKIYITGKGRCNLTNACDKEDYISRLNSNPRFFYSSFAGMDNVAVMSFFEDNGLRLKTERGGRVFPASDKASDVTKTLAGLLSRYRVKVCLNTEVQGLLLEEEGSQEASSRTGEGGLQEELSLSRRGAFSDDGAGQKTRRLCCKGVRLAEGSEIPADAVIVATGGLSYPSTGSTGDGYRFAKEAGHSVTGLYPALVPFNARLDCGYPIEKLQGVSLKNIEIKVFKEGSKKTLYKEFGELLFTHFGISGPVVLHLSGVAAKSISEGPLRMEIDLKPAIDDETLLSRLKREIEYAPKKSIKTVMRRLLPQALTEPVLVQSGVPRELEAGKLGEVWLKKISEALRNFTVILESARGFNEAVITQGGIDVREIEPKTMASKKTEGLFFAGEVMDLDAMTGGYNLQIAWSTGAAAGRAAAGPEKELAQRKGKAAVIRKEKTDAPEKDGKESASGTSIRREKMNRSIAIDGPAGAGKSTIAKRLSAELGMIYVDTGAMYRAMAVHFLRSGLLPDDEAGISAACENAEVEIVYENGAQQVILNGENVTGLLRTEEVGNMASASSVYAAVRSRLVALQQSLARKTPVVMDGRDIGTVVLPDAALKIYLTASIKERARRRVNELVMKGQNPDPAQIERDIEERDFRDMNRPIGPLKKAEDAVEIDSSDMTIEEVVSAIKENYAKRA